MGTAQESLGRLEETVAGHTTQIEGLQGDMTTAQTDIDNLKTQVDQNATTITEVKETADGAYIIAGTTQTKVNQHIDPDGNISGANGTFTGDLKGDTILGNSGLIGGVSMEDGHVQATDGIWAGTENQFHVDENGNMTTDGNVTANTIEGTVVKGDYGMFGNTVISDNEGIVMNKVTEAADGSTVNEEVFKVDKDGNLTAESATISGNLTADTIVAENGGTIGNVTMVNGTINSYDQQGNRDLYYDGEGNMTMTGSLTADTVTATNGNFDLVTGEDAKFTGTVSAANGSFSGNVAVAGDVYVGGRTEGVGASLNAHDALIKENAAAIQQNSNAIGSLSSQVNDLGGEIDNVGAISAALAGLHPLDYDGTGSKFQLAAAMGNYDGTQAAAIGGFYHFNEDVMMSVGGATSFGGDNKSAFNVGVSFRVGQGSSGTKVNSDDVLAQLEAMNEKIAALEAENQSLSEKVAALEAPAPAAE